MTLLVIGCLSFIPLFAYDALKLKKSSKYIALLFLLGACMLLISTILLLRNAYALYRPGNWVFIVLSVFFFLLEVYSLFIELSIVAAYIQTEANQVVDTGTYALCRHPGVLWFGLMYLFLALAFPSVEFFLCALCYTAMDIAYVIFEEKFIFSKRIHGYRDYMKSTPLLIPNKKSFERCLNTLNKRVKE